jgi:hypothetical protein
MNWLKEKNEKDAGNSSTTTPDIPDISIDSESSEKIEKTASESEYENWEEEVSDKKVKKHAEKSKGTDLEKYDFTAMLLSAFLIFAPVTLLILGLFALISWVFF